MSLLVGDAEGLPAPAIATIREAVDGVLAQDAAAQGGGLMSRLVVTNASKIFLMPRPVERAAKIVYTSASCTSCVGVYRWR